MPVKTKKIILQNQTGKPLVIVAMVKNQVIKFWLRSSPPVVEPSSGAVFKVDPNHHLEITNKDYSQWAIYNRSGSDVICRAIPVNAEGELHLILRLQTN